MYSQMRPHDTMPILYCTAGADSMLPRLEEDLGRLSPCRIKSIQQLIGGKIHHFTTLPCPSDQKHSVRSQPFTGLPQRLIKIGGKEQQMRKCQTNLFSQRLDLFLHERRRPLCQFREQGEPSLHFRLSLFAVQDMCLRMRPEHHHFQQALQFLRQIAQSFSDIRGLCYPFLMPSYVGLWYPSKGFLALGYTLGLSLDDRQTILQLMQNPSTAPLNLRGKRQHVPDIALVLTEPFQLIECFVNGSSSITDTALAEDSLLLQVPPLHYPTFSVHLYRR